MGKIEDDSLLASREYARILSKLTFNAKLSKFTFQGSSNVNFPIRLEGLAYSHGQFSSYKPEVRHIPECLTHHLLTRPSDVHGLTTALAWPKIFENQSRRLRPRLLSEFFAL
jgi:hypothetical protein